MIVDKQKRNIRKTLIIELVLLGIVILTTVWFVFYRYQNVSSGGNSNSAIFTEVKKWLPTAAWSSPVKNSNNNATLNGTLQASPATIQSFQSSSKYLKTQGYSIDNSLAADGPGASTWAYTKNVNGQASTVIFSFKVSPSSSNSNEPVQFNCPCESNVSVEVKTMGGIIIK